MTLKDKLIVFSINLLTAILVGVLARYGIHIDIPPIKVETVPPQEFRPKPEPQPEPKPTPKPDILGAICRARTSVGGCTAVIIGPRRADNRYHVLTAAHCVKGLKDRFTITTKSGHIVSCTVYQFDSRSDIAWALTDTSTTELPFAVLADSNPRIGVRVSHSGYGIDKPGNVENGEILSECQPNGRIRMRLSVSSGDSGGAIYDSTSGEVYSIVCCTVSDGRTSWTEGPCTTAIRSLMTYHDFSEDLNPVPIRSCD